MEAVPTASAAPPPPESGVREASFEDDPRKWWALAVLLLAQVMIILDIAIVNVAIPSAQADLHIAPADVQWVVTAYLLPFGALLLLGGRIADYTGRKRVFCVATLGFAVASGIGGAASTEGVLFAARAFQGVFAAAMAPALLSMLTLGFPTGSDRSRAFSLYGGVSAAGGALGLVIGGLLTEYLSWRWSLLINVPLSLIVIAGAVPLLRESRASGDRHYDLIGAALGTFGLLGVIYAIANAAEEGWGSSATLTILGAGLALLFLFGLWELRARHPLLPLPILLDRSRAGGFLALAMLYGPGTGMTLLMLVFLQGPLGESALSAGLHFVPIPVFAIFGAMASMRLLPRVPPRWIFAAGTILASLGLLAVTRVGTDAEFVSDMLPAFALYGLGSAVLFVAGNAIALVRVPDGDTGLASAVINTMQQVGAALGVAILSTVAASATTSYVAEHQADGPAALVDGIVHGNNEAFVLGAALMLGAGLISVLLIRPDEQLIDPGDAAEPADSEGSEGEPAASPSRDRAPAPPPAPAPVLVERVEGLQGWLFEIERRQRRMGWLGGLTALAAVAAAVGVLGLGVANQRNSASDDDLERLTEEVESLQTEVARTSDQLAGINRRFSSMEKRIDDLDRRRREDAAAIARLQRRGETASAAAPPLEPGTTR